MPEAKLYNTKTAMIAINLKEIARETAHKTKVFQKQVKRSRCAA